MWILSTFCLLLVVISCEAQQTPAIGRGGTPCYDTFNRPQRCIPEFENAAFGVVMEATNTCGQNGDMEYCVQTGVNGIRKSCEICHPGEHDPRYLTDYITDYSTWWQSETMYEGIQWPNQVNLTLKFDKTFDITYVRLIFNSPRPESFYISKKVTSDGPWIPFQYYSASCRDTYGLPDMTHTTKGEETRALCTSEYSDISPLTDGNIAFGTLEGRPSAYNFDSSPELQEWVTATEIMITLDRLNTFGDEVFGDYQVLKSYFYAISDIAVGARCKCNGHASECITSSGVDGSKRRVCKCEHNTAGSDCNECLPFYNDAPWGRATAQNAHECKQCNCNGYSNRCFFDQKLYEQTGHGGHCLDCIANRDGANCERCKENFYMREDGYCIPCQCNSIGSRNLQCNAEGKCQCKPGVTGEKCDRCEENFYDFSSLGCKTCGCHPAGSFRNEPRCDANTGICQCKDNVEGKQCNDCKPGFFNLDEENEFGCTPCFCYGHSAQCSSASQFFRYIVASSFFRGNEKWTAEDEYHRKIEVKYEPISQSIGVHTTGDEAVYFVAPNRFLGDQRTSYNQLLEFTLRIGDNRVVPTATDIILEGSGTSVTNTIFAQKNPVPNMQSQVYKFRLHEHPDYGWQPRLPSRSFISILTNLTAIKIKGTYAPEGVGFLDEVKLETASRGVAGKPALWVESCACPTGYVGQFCESCAPGFRHEPALGGSFMPCVPCDCNNHAEICDSETGRCICSHNTAGENCEFCARGYYGNALGGTKNDCKPCGCPEGGACIQIDDDMTMCTECPTGYTGHKCDLCSDGYYGDPTGRYGPRSPCRECECNKNIDLNAIGNCNTTSGECLRCIYNTGGVQCQECLPGFYGNAVVLPKGDCKPCTCYPVGTVAEKSGAPDCDQTTGTCSCKPHVVGLNCDRCEDGYYNIMSGEGCHACNCDSIGSYNQTCDLLTGQCYCRPGVTGLRCDHCEARKYGFSVEGCKDCDCDSIGSKDLQCDPFGQCPCLDNVEGRRCDRCKENKYDRKRGCIDCPDCYNLVRDAYRTHENKLERLNDILDEIERRPTVIADDEFPEELEKLRTNISNTYEKVKNITGDHSAIQQVHDIREREKEISRTLSEIDETLFLFREKSHITEMNLDHIETNLEEGEMRLSEITSTFDSQAKEALDHAIESSKKAGQQSEKMTEIAHEAREIAEQLDEKAKKITDTAAEAKNKSIEAYLTAKNATSDQSDVSDKARKLKHEILDLENKLNRTKEWTSEVASKSLIAKNDALTLLNEVKNLEVPTIDIPELKFRSDDLRDRAYKLRNESEALFRDSQEMRKNVEEKSNIARSLLETAYEQQSITDELLNDIHATKERTDNSIDRWKKILNDTESIYNDLKDFDSETQKSRQEADEALSTIKNIEAIIIEASNKTYEDQQALKDATQNANSALVKAVQADGLAKNASNVAEKIKQEAGQLLRNTTILTEDAELMSEKVVETNKTLNGYLGYASTNGSFINEAKEKVGSAGKETDETSKKVTELLQNVENIMAELANSPDINDTEINRLEEVIQQTEFQLQESKLDEKLANLQKEHQEQADLIEQYKIDIKKLQDDVDNIEAIVHALPEGCFRNLELEP
ncbi:laminin subunit gamma-1-like [Diorhabda carinulata]|uniref:laminin subunit gamma-1-like n=1 Tax=Diorhabda carinulata TaxID=1163345 RepID=UPI0025A07C83|nr:laminin subunit gamma-1-like [Diorhabda carinulata]XP_057672532.1 laminin subunit gamma-1-like [Diorhabda carinulata]